jgi:tRNA(Arg) A34 adenosine deaminase TadA
LRIEKNTNEFGNPQSEIRNRYGLDKRLEHDIKKMNFFQKIRQSDSLLSPGNFPAGKEYGEPAIDLRPLHSEDAQFMRIAIEEAKRAGEEGEVPIGAVLVSGGEVIGRGRNRPVALSDPTAHAEIQALRQGAARRGNYRLPGSTLYVTVEPCVMCAGAALQARLGRLVFGTEDPKSGAVSSLFSLLADPRLNHRVEVDSGVLREECRELLQRFFQERR